MFRSSLECQIFFNLSSPFFFDSDDFNAAPYIASWLGHIRDGSAAAALQCVPPDVKRRIITCLYKKEMRVNMEEEYNFYFLMITTSGYLSFIPVSHSS